jgi:hypothetical protein
MIIFVNIIFCWFQDLVIQEDACKAVLHETETKGPFKVSMLRKYESLKDKYPPPRHELLEERGVEETKN